VTRQCPMCKSDIVKPGPLNLYIFVIEGDICDTCRENGAAFVYDPKIKWSSLGRHALAASLATPDITLAKCTLVYVNVVCRRYISFDDWLEGSV